MTERLELKAVVADPGQPERIIAPRGRIGKRRFRKANATGRTEGGEQFVPLGYPMLHSPTWRSLSGAAVKVFLEIRSRYDGRNNGKLTLSLDEAARLLGIGKATAARAFEELEAKGFLAQTRLGRWYGRQASEYATTDRSLNGHLPTNAWKQWRPEKQSLGSETDHIHALTGPLQNR
jgi:hypothetical protein